MAAWFSTLLSDAGAFLKTLLASLLSILPDSPFQFVTGSGKIATYLGYFNYFVPISSMLATLELWLACIALYYVVSVALRWAKAIE